MMREALTRNVFKVRAGRVTRESDSIAMEEPMEIRLRWQNGGDVQQRSLAITMRTPGSDFELAAGFLLAEGVIGSREELADISYCLEEAEEQQRNVVLVTLSPGVTFDLERLQRNFYTTSSCGVCGKASLESLEVQGCEELPAEWSVDPALISRLPGVLRERQALFAETGGLHAAGLFGLDGRLQDLREDVGRHNALDKLAGYQLLQGSVPLRESLLLLSGRASFELVQKALVAGIPLVASVGAPSSLAVDLAENFGQTLIGFVKDTGFNIYTCPERVGV